MKLVRIEAAAIGDGELSVSVLNGSGSSDNASLYLKQGEAVTVTMPDNGKVLVEFEAEE